MANELQFSATLKDNVTERLTAIQNKIDGMKDLTINLNIKGGGAGEADAGLQKLKDDLKTVESQLKSSNERLADFKEGIKLNTTSWDESKRKVSELNSQIETLANTWKSMPKEVDFGKGLEKSMSGMYNIIEDAEKKLARIAKIPNAWDSEFDLLQSSLKYMKQSIDSMWGDAVHGMKFPTEQLRDQFQVALKELRGQFDVFYGDLWGNFGSKDNRGRLKFSIEDINNFQKWNGDWAGEGLSYVEDAHEKLLRIYTLVQHLRDFGNQPLLAGLEKDANDADALGNRIAILEERIERMRSAITYNGFDNAGSEEFGNNVIHYQQRLENVLELIKGIKSAFHDNVFGESSFADVEAQFKQMIATQQEALRQAEQQLAKEASIKWNEEGVAMAQAQVDARKKILQDTENVSKFLTLTGDKNEASNLQHSADAYAQVTNNAITKLESTISSLETQKAELTQKISDAGKQTGKSMPIEVFLKKDTWTAQLAELDEQIKKFNADHKINIDANLNNGGGAGNVQDLTTLEKAKAEATQKVNDLLEQQKKVESELAALRSKTYEGYDERQISRVRQSVEDAEASIQRLREKYGVKDLFYNSPDWKQKLVEFSGNSQTEGMEKLAAARSKINGNLDEEIEKMQRIIALAEKDVQLNDYIRNHSFANALTDGNQKAIEYYRAAIKTDYEGYAELAYLKEQRSLLKQNYRNADIDDSLNGNMKAWKEEIAILDEIIKRREKLFAASEKYDSFSYESKELKQAREDQKEYERASNVVAAYSGIVADANKKDQELAAGREAVNQKLRESTEIEQKLTAAKEAETQAQNELNAAKNKASNSTDVLVHVQLEDQKLVEEQLRTLTTYLTEWSKTTPVVLSAKIGDIVTSSIQSSSQMFEAMAGMANGAIPEIQKKLGTGELTKQFKDTDEAVQVLKKHFEDLAATTEKDKLAVNTGKNTGINAELNSVIKLIEQLKTQADTIKPDTLTEWVNKVKAGLDSMQIGDASSRFAAGINTIKVALSQMERMGTEGVSPLESAVLKAEAAIAQSVIGIKQAVSGMTEALSNDNLTAFKKRAEDAATAINNLKEQVSGFNNVMVNEKGMADLITGLGALIRNLKVITGDDPFARATNGFSQYENSIERIKNVLTGLIADEEKLNAVMATTSNDNARSRIGASLESIQDYRRKLQEQLAKPFEEWNFSEVKTMLSSERVALDSETAATLKYAESMRVAQNEVNKLTELTAQYAATIAEMKQRGMETSGMEKFLQGIQNYKGIFESLLNSQTTGAVEVTRDANYTALLNQAAKAGSEAAQGMKEYDSVLAKVNQSIDALTQAEKNLNEAINLGRQRNTNTSNLEQYRIEVQSLLNTISGAKSPQDALNAIMGNPTLIKEVSQALADKARQDKEDVKNKQDATKAYVDLNSKVQDCANTLARYNALTDASKQLIDVQALNTAGRWYETQRSVMESIKNGNDDTNVARYRSEQTYLEKQIESNKALAKIKQDIKKQETLERKNAPSADAQNAEAARRAYASLSTTIETLKKKIAEGTKFNIDTTAIEKAKTELEGFREKMSQIMNGVSRDKAYNITQSDPYRNAITGATQAQVELTEKINEAKANGASATAKLSDEERRLADAINQANSAGRVQSQVLGDLQSMAMQYLSVYAAQQFVKEMANITGELELQKKSLEVILNSASMAQQLYGQIQSLSQESPYTFQDLLKSTRQLAAFGVETKDLYGTMKALSDIGAGLSVDVNRLILAFGHTKSYGYLSGIQNRQFENAGIDLMGELMKKYNAQADLDAAAGRQATYVTRKDLFQRMRSRDIPFEDVQSVVLGLDKEGGKFYNMQERQFETLGGKLRNLQNNYNIMMSEMGQSNMDLLMGGVNVMNNLTENWRSWWNIIKEVVVALGAVKVAQMALGSNAFGIANTQMTRDNIQKSILRGNTGWNVGQAYNTQGIAYGQGILNSNMSTLQKAKSVMFSSVDKQTREMVLRELGASEKYIARINNVSSKTGFLWQRASLSIKAFAAEAKASMVALATNPMTWIFAAVAGITAIISRLSEASELQEKLLNDAQEAGRTDNKNIEDIFKESPYAKRSQIGSQLVNGVPVFKYSLEFDEESIRQHGPLQVLEEITKQLQQYSPLYQGQIIDIMALDNDMERVKKAFDSLNKTQLVDKVMSSTQGLSSTLAEGPEWYNLSLTDNFIQDLGDFKKQISSAGSLIRQLTSSEEKYVNSFSERTRQLIESQQALTGSDRETTIKNLYMQGNRDVKSDMYSVGNTWNKPGSWFTINNNDDIKEGAENVAKQFITDFGVFFNNDNETSAIYFQNWLNRMFSEAKISDAAQQMDITNIILQSLESQGDSGKRFAEYFRGLKLKEHFAAEVQGMVNDNTTAADAKKMLDNISEKTLAWAKEQGLITGTISAEQGREYARMFKEAFDAEMNANTLQYDWQKRGKGFFTVNTTMRNNIKTVINIDEFAQSVQKNLKEAQEYLKRNEGHIKKLALKLGIKLDTVLDAKTLENLVATIRKHALDKLRKGDIAGADQLWDQAQEFSDYLNVLKGSEEDKKWLNAEGYPESDSNKTKSKNTGNQEDKLARRFREETKLIQDAYQWYKKWEKEIGNEGALQKVNERFGDMLAKSGISFKDIPNYKQTLTKVLDEANKAYNTKGHKNSYMLEAIKTLKDAIENVDFDTFQDASEKALSAVQRKLEDLSRQWEIFNSVRDTTGDEDLAMQMSGMTRDDFMGGYLTKNNALKQQIQKQMLANGLTQGLNWDELFAMDEDTLTKHIMDITKATTKAQDNIKALVKAIQEWQKAEQDLKKEDLLTSGKIIGSLMDVPSQQRRIEMERQNQRDSIDRSELLYKNTNGREGLSSAEATKARNYVDAQALEKSEKLSSDYLTVFAYAVNHTTNELENAAKALKANVRQRVEANQITAQQGAEENTKIDKAINDAIKSTLFGNKSNLTTFIQGGLPGLQSSLTSQLEEAQTRADNAKQEGNIGLSYAWGEEVKKRQEELDKINKVINGLDNFSTCLSLITGVFDGLQHSCQTLSTMFEALGNETMANWFSDASDIIGGISGIFSPVNNIVGNALSGNVGGIISSAISAPVDMIASPITAFSKLHDKKIERQIEDLKKELSELNSAVDTIKRNRERTLGYDTGNNTREMAQYYQQLANGSILKSGLLIGYQSNQANQAMADYYSKAAGDQDINGYQQEYNDLLAERTNLMEQYNAENSKKDSDDSKLAEYKDQIAELDDEIKYYAEDMYKSLYGIDFSGWADQISDALMTAFENGTDAMESFEDTARSIMQSVVQNVLKLAIISPIMEELRDALSKVYDVNNPQGSTDSMLNILATYFGDGGKMTTALSIFNNTLTATNDKLASMGMELRDIEEIANTLYGIDLDSWAQSIGDALMDAFYNGELAAESYADTVKSVMQDVVKQMLETAYLEPMMDNLKNMLFGYTDSAGVTHAGAFNANNPTGSIADVVAVLKSYLGEGGDGAALITASTEFANGVEQLLEESGLSLYNTSSTNTRNAITNQATEETMSTVSGYLAAIRQDTSVQRVYITQLVADYMSDYQQFSKDNHTALSSIDQNVKNIYDLLTTTGSLYGQLKGLRDDVHSVMLHNNSFKMA